jgi:hypothetical protein
VGHREDLRADSDAENVALTWYHRHNGALFPTNTVSRYGVFSTNGLDTISDVFDISPDDTSWSPCPTYGNYFAGDYVGAVIVPGSVWDLPGYPGPGSPPRMLEAITHSTSCTNFGDFFHVQGIVW